MMADVIELEVAGRARLTAVAPAECMLCYVQRMILAHGCDGSRWRRRWRRWRDAMPGPGMRYGCDCELFISGWQLQTDPRTGAPRWPVAGCAGVTADLPAPCARDHVGQCWPRRSRCVDTCIRWSVST